MNENDKNVSNDPRMYRIYSTDDNERRRAIENKTNNQKKIFFGSI